MIRNYFFIVLCLAAPALVHAQFQKGDKMIGTSVASLLFNSGSSTVSFASGVSGYSTSNTGYNVRIDPSIGWFLSEKTAVGASLFLNPTGDKVRYSSQGSDFQEDKNNAYNIGIGAFVRNYFGSTSFMPFGQFGFNVGIASRHIEGFKYYGGTPARKESYDGKSSGGFFTNATLQLGLTKMISPSVGLDLFVGYNYSYSKNTFSTTTLTDIDIDGDIDTRAENESTTKYTNHGAMAGVGIQVFIGKKK